MRKVRSYILFNAFPALMTTCRPTGWHGESGIALSGGHLTVDFLDSNNRHISTHHVYPSEAAYGA